MQSLLEKLPASIRFGAGAVSQVGTVASGLGKKALIVTGRSSAKKSGVLDKVSGLLEANGVDWAVFDRVPANPTTDTAKDGLAVLRENACDFVIGLGGGSSLDCAKTIAFLAKHDGPLFDYIYGRLEAGEALPILAIPTTCGTGSEANYFAVTTDSETHDKKSLRTASIFPDVSLVDSNLMKTMPKRLLAAVGFDAICHLMEAYLSKGCTPEVAEQALGGLALAVPALPRLYAGIGTAADWEALTLSSTIGGWCIGQAGVTAPHGLEHPLSGLYNLTHGEGLAALTPVITELSWAEEPARYTRIARLFGTDAAGLTDTLTEYIQKLGLPTKLSLGKNYAADIPWLVENTIKVSIGGLKGHPVFFDEEALRLIFSRISE
ncbi:MAG: iron-containing alcohol dehydrogenase [Oscillospiraceae bacterium]|jgi:alcohol dehydrogenase class IV|nr:iron-containing alcohol dehydrogenase [Oscillospiraceae bacterium]